jgi:hypothetical protein
MATLPPAGDKYDFCSANGNHDLSIIPAGTLAVAATDAPVRLQRGDVTFGAIHVASRHGIWLDTYKKCVEEMIWLKLQQSGTIYCTEDEDKFKVSIVLHPTALLVLRYIPRLRDPFFAVTTLYPVNTRLDGSVVGKYFGPGNVNMPIFTWPVPRLAPTVTIKKRRVLILP